MEEKHLELKNKIDELVKKFNAKSRSVIIDMLIEKSEL